MPLIRCVVCGKEKKATRKTAKYCSHRCMGIDQTGRSKPHSAEHEEKRLAAVRVAGAKRRGVKTGPRPPEVIQKMLAGSAAWRVNNSDAARAKSVANLPKDTTAEKNPNWRGGRTKQARDFYTQNSRKMAKWRRLVLERDGHKCQDCGAATRLECHHILPLVATHEFAFNRANGVTLCHECHKKTDSWAAKGRDGSWGNRKMKAGNIHILFVPQSWQDYDTVGNWQVGASGSVLVLVTRMRNPVHEQAVALHELVEALLCKAKGITSTAVDAFDMGPGKDLDEPGFSPDAPYHVQHCWADVIERAFIAAAGESWTAYDNAVGDHGCVC